MSSKARFEPNINHALLVPARRAFNECLKYALDKALRTGSNEGSASLKVSFEINEVLNMETKAFERIPQIKFKASYSVPLKDSIDGEVMDRSTIEADDDFGWLLVNSQISMDEIMEEAKS